MRLSSEFIQLPLSFDAVRLAAELAGVDEAEWRPHPQGFAGNFALPLVARGGDPGDDAVDGPMRPTPALARLPYLRQVMASFGCVLGRSRLMRLDGNAEVGLHTDINYYWQQRVRIHVPIVTTPSVTFRCADKALHMRAGECWIFDTGRLHNVVNEQPTRRIHLVADTQGSGPFWTMVAAGRDPFAAAVADFTARRIDFDPALDARFDCENVNHPRVMSPWEQRALAEPILRDVADEPDGASAARRLRAVVDPWMHDWAQAWALHGDSASGLDDYRRLRARLSTALDALQGCGRLQGNDAALCLRHVLVRPALSSAYEAEAASPVSAQAQSGVQAASAAPPPAVAPRARRRPPGRGAVIIVSPPRSGSTLLFETLARSPDLCSIGGESHALIEGIEGLSPAAQDWHSNRLDAAAATPERIDALRRAFGAALRDRHGRLPLPGMRMLEKTPKNALRIPLLARAFPEARFVVLERDHREVLASMLEAWRSGRFVTYPGLPGWSGPPWSLLLVPGWPELVGRPLAEIVVQQWCRTMETMEGDLAALPSARVLRVGYADLVADPPATVERLCEALGLDWDQPIEARLPNSRFTVSAPSAGKWLRHADELAPWLPQAEALVERLRRRDAA